ncbi:SRPBCC family protein [Streptomyces sp. NPDC046860]|uniref:SRPBCC family protein n=1 Tax=Streptomyces sp. NPDC046860 TaxID=3154495 RepID=UPI0033E22C2F
MASTSVSRIVPASPDDVWRLVGGFGSLPDWLPFIPSSTLEDGGRTRRLGDQEGQTIVERLIAYDDEARSYSYSILEAPFPVTDYLSTLRVWAVAGNDAVSEVQWSGRFTPRDVPDADVVALFTGIYSDGLDSLRSALG